MRQGLEHRRRRSSGKASVQLAADEWSESESAESPMELKVPAARKVKKKRFV